MHNAPKVIERKDASGKAEYGVQLSPDHVKWCDSLPHAMATYASACNSKAKRKEARRNMRYRPLKRTK